MCVCVCVCMCMCVCVVTPQYSRNHSVSKKHKTIHPFKLHLIQNGPLIQHTLLPTTVMVFETFLETIL